MKHQAVVDYTIENYYNYCSDFTFSLQKERNKILPPGFTLCHLNKKNKVIFMHIDKCASTSIGYAFALSNNFRDLSTTKNATSLKQFFIENNYQFYAVIREPKSRYVSGLQEFIKLHNPLIDDVVYNLENNKFIFDEHTAPQHCFLFLCENKCNYLKLDSNLSNKISLIVNEKVILTNENSSIPSIKKLSTSLFENYCKNNDQFYKLYELDFELYRNSK